MTAEMDENKTYIYFWTQASEENTFCQLDHNGKILVLILHSIMHKTER